MLASINSRLSKILDISINQIDKTVNLLDDGATVPFIARYRKEITGGLDDIQLRTLVEQLTYLRELDERREVILNSIQEQGKLTTELEMAIFQADTKTALEDLYLPYKPKRRTKAQIAKEAGLEPLALSILNDQDLDIDEEAKKYINNEHNIPDIKAALDGASYIVMDIFAENAQILGQIRNKLWQEGLLTTKVIEGKEDIGIKFKDYFDYTETINTIPSHRVLATFRGYNEKVLSLEIDYPEKANNSSSTINSYEQIIINEYNIRTSHKWLMHCVYLCFKAKIFPSLENELLNKTKEIAEEEAIKVFATNLKNLLLQAPAGGVATMGLDPGIRTGVKIAIMDKTGQVIDTGTIYPFEPRNEYSKAITSLFTMAKKYSIELIAIGNGTASRETETLVAEMLKQYPEIKATKVIVSEAGASVYSASEYASKEMPSLDVSLRGAVSIGRRLQDPLAELVKIDPKSIGVGQYQHDINQNKLSNSLNNVVEDCVNSVGVDINTASVPLLTRISGLNTIIANNIVNYRNENGAFKNRNELKNIPRLGDKTFEQCAGFLRIHNGDNKLDESAVHPEAYNLIDNISKKLGIKIEEIIGNTNVVKKIIPEDYIDSKFGLPTIIDILNELEKPGRDPRGEFKTAKFKENIHSINDLSVGMYLEGVITNVTNFGAFVDIGVHQDGLVHISEITDKFISDPNLVIKTGQIVKVKVLDVDKIRKRISLSMKNSSSIKPSQKIEPRSQDKKDNAYYKTNNNSNIKTRVSTPQNSLAYAFSKMKV